jgi:hypothetical protein
MHTVIIVLHNAPSIHHIERRILDNRKVYCLAINKNNGSSLPPIVCRRAHVLFTLFVLDVQHILCFVFALFSFVLCTLCCQFLWIVYL